MTARRRRSRHPSRGRASDRFVVLMTPSKETRRAGKGPARKELARGGAGPDTEPDHPATQSRSSERGGPLGRPDTVHRFAAPRRRRGARTNVPASEAAGKRGSRWDHGRGIRTESGSQSPEPLRACSHRALPAAAGSARLHSEIRWRTATARGADLGGQDRPGRGGRDAERHLRSRLPRIFLRLPAGAKPAPGSLVATHGDHESACELGARCRYPQLL